MERPGACLRGVHPLGPVAPWGPTHAGRIVALTGKGGSIGPFSHRHRITCPEYATGVADMGALPDPVGREDTDVARSHQGPIMQDLPIEEAPAPSPPEVPRPL